MRKYIVLILIFFLFMPKTFANVHSNQRLQAQLGEVLHIEKIICENSEYNKKDS